MKAFTTIILIFNLTIMATSQHICKGESFDAQYVLRDNQAYWAITKGESLENHLTIREDKWICKGDGLSPEATFRDGKWLYKNEGYVVLYIVRDNSSYVAICEGESYESLYSVRDNGSYIAICKGDSYDPEYVIRGGNVTTIQLLALLNAVGIIEF